jgi:hypothetical protein
VLAGERQGNHESPTGAARDGRDLAARAADEPLRDGGGREKAVVLTGDMNHELDAATTQILNGPTGSEIGTNGFGHPDDELANAR